MAERPPVDPALLTRLTGEAPKRLVRKLDKSPDLAEAWTWSEAGVLTDKGETVTFGLEGGVVRDATCTCLLSPRCLHVLASLSLLPLGEAGAPEAVEAEPVGPELSEAQSAAAQGAFTSAARVLDAGAAGSGAILQAEVLRAVHQCRAQGLHRAAAAGVRVVEGLRKLRVQSRDADAGVVARELAELLRSAHLVADGDPNGLGVGRRKYSEISSLRLYGLCCEPVATESGYAGVVTWLCDADGEVYSLNDVMPGDAERARTAYRGPVGLGEVRLSHAEVARAGLLVARGTASAEGRLGRGQGTRAAPASGVDWEASPLLERFTEPAGEQVARALRAPRRLLFLRGPVIGSAEGALVMDCGVAIRCLPATLRVPGADYALTLLRRLVGHELMIVARLRPSEARTVTLLAARPLAGAHLPEAWAGQLHPGLDQVQATHLPGAPGPELLWMRPADPLGPLRGRLERMAVGGRASLSFSEAPKRDVATLDRRMMRGGAALLQALVEQAHEAPRDLRGARLPGASEPLARRWLQAMVYERAAREHLMQAAWRSE